MVAAPGATRAGGGGAAGTWSPGIALLVAAPFAYLPAVRWPLFGPLLVGAVLAGLLLVALLQRTAFGGVALGLCAVMMAYPAFLPHRPVGVSGVVEGGTFDARARAQLAIVLALAASAGWLWLSTCGSAAILGRTPWRAFALYGALVLLSLAYTPDRAWAGYAALKLVGLLLVLAVLAVLVRGAAQVRRVLDALLATCAVIILCYLLDIAVGAAVLDPVEARWTTSWLAAPNASILACAFTTVMGARCFTAPTGRGAAFAGSLTALGALSGLLTGGKSALVAAAVALAVAVALIVVRQRRRARSAALGRLLPVGLALALVGLYVAMTNIGLAAHLAAYTGNRFIDPTNLTGRVPVWAVAIRSGLERPVLGHGYMSTFALRLDNGRGFVATQAHNAFVQTFFDLGLVGLCLVVAIYLGAWRAGLRAALTLPTTDARWALSVEALAALVMLTIVSLTEDIFGGIVESRTVLFVLVVLAVHRLAPPVGGVRRIAGFADAGR